MLKYNAINTEYVNAIRNGGLDANQQKAIRFISDGEGNPCRHCLNDIEQGETILLFAYRPFETNHAYAETGPIFVHEKNCTRYSKTKELPSSFQTRSHYMLRAYDKQNHSIVEGSGQRVKTKLIDEVARELFQNDQVGYIHLRSASNTCYSLKITKN